MKKTTTTALLLAGFGCETAPMTQGDDDPNNTWEGYEELAALAATTGGVPLGQGFAWSGDAVIAMTLTEHGTPTSLEDVQRMDRVEYARAKLAAAEVDLHEARKRLAYLEGPNAVPVSPMTLAEDIAQYRRGIPITERKVQRLRDELEEAIRRDETGLYMPPPEEQSCPGKVDIRESAESMPGATYVFPCCGNGKRMLTESLSQHWNQNPANHEVSGNLVAKEGGAGKILWTADPPFADYDFDCLRNWSPRHEVPTRVTLPDLHPYTSWCWEGSAFHRAWSDSGEDWASSVIPRAHQECRDFPRPRDNN